MAEDEETTHELNSANAVNAILTRLDRIESENREFRVEIMKLIGKDTKPLTEMLVETRQKIEQIEAKVDHVNTKVAEIETKVDGGFNEVRELIKSVNRKIGVLSKDFIDVRADLEGHEARLERANL